MDVYEYAHKIIGQMIESGEINAPKYNGEDYDCLCSMDKGDLVLFTLKILDMYNEECNN